MEIVPIFVGIKTSCKVDWAYTPGMMPKITDQHKDVVTVERDDDTIMFV